MAQSPLGEQFHNAVSLLKLRLSPLSNDPKTAVDVALADGALDEAQAAFMRECLHIDEMLEIGQVTPECVTYDQIDQIRRYTSLIG